MICTAINPPPAAQYCEIPPGRGVRNESLEALRYAVLTMQDLIEGIQNKWPTDRPLPPDLAAKLKFGAFAVAHLRSGAIRKLAESARP